MRKEHYWLQIVAIIYEVFYLLPLFLKFKFSLNHYLKGHYVGVVFLFHYVHDYIINLSNFSVFRYLFYEHTPNLLLRLAAFSCKIRINFCMIRSSIKLIFVNCEKYFRVIMRVFLRFNLALWNLYYYVISNLVRFHI